LGDNICKLFRIFAITLSPHTHFVIKKKVILKINFVCGIFFCGQFCGLFVAQLLF